MVRKIDVQEMLDGLGDICILDVRTPSEFRQGHIPGAVNMPLFSDDERAEVGTLYKQDGPDKAMCRGLEIVGPRMFQIPGTARALANGRNIVLHCWRGGKRSSSVAWLLHFTGTPVTLLEGGYKAFRQHMHNYFENLPFQLIVLGGKTGSGKTDVLHTLRTHGQQVVDFEHLACHKGSAFGWIGEEPQPSTEHFENVVFAEFCHLDPNRPVWVENESRSIGRVFIPQALWKYMKASPLIQLDVPVAERVERLVRMYAGSENTGSLKDAFIKIARRLGGQHVKEALYALDSGDFRSAAHIALKYYDKTYDYNLSVSKSPVIHTYKPRPGTSTSDIAHGLIALAGNILTLPV